MRAAIKAVLVVVLVCTPLAIVSPVAYSRPGDLTYDVDNGMRFRESAGLASSREVAERAVSNPDVYSNLEWGVPLKETEAAELDKRVQLQRATQDAIRYASEQDGYAGMYFDQPAGGTAVFRFTTDASQHASRLESLVPKGLGFEVRGADATMKELERTAERILEDAKALGDSGIRISSVGPQARSNSVIVGLRTANEDAERELKALYGPQVKVEVEGPVVADACTGRGNCGDPPDEPWKGGLRINRDGCPSCQCTSAFLARRNTNVVMVTAGHCIGIHGGAGTAWRHNGRVIGNALGGWIWHDGGNADVGWIDVEQPQQVTPKNLIYGGTGPRTMTGVTSNGQQHEGGFVCRSAEQTGYLCGTILIKASGNMNVEGRIIKNLFKTDFDADVGDSGGVYFVGNDIYGIHSDSLGDVTPPQDGRSWYTPAERAESQGDFSICTSSGC